MFFRLLLPLLGLSLSACSGQASAGGGWDNNQAEILQEPESSLFISSSTAMPRSASRDNAYVLHLNNFTAESYELLSASVTSMTSESASQIVALSTRLCQVVESEHSCPLWITVKRGILSTDALITVDLRRNDGRLERLNKFIRMGNNSGASSGVVFNNDIKQLIVESGNTGISIPFLLTESYDYLAANNSSLWCKYSGYGKGNSCTLTLNGNVLSSDTILTFGLTAYRDSLVTVPIAESLPVEVNPRADLLVSQDLKITADGEGIVLITLFNNGNATASGIEKVFAINSKLQSPADKDSCSTTLAAGAYCKFAISALATQSGQESIKIKYHNNLVATSYDTTTTVHYTVIEKPIVNLPAVASGWGSNGVTWDVLKNPSVVVPERFTLGSGKEAGCFTDKLTGLMWPRNGNFGTGKNFAQMVYAASKLNLCGYSDWHLPTINELRSLVNYTASGSSVSWLNHLKLGNEFIFTEPLVAGAYASSSDGPNTWFIDFSKGLLNRDASANGSGENYYMLPVRINNPSAPAAVSATGEINGATISSSFGIAWPSPRFVRTNEDCIVDRLSGLMWAQDASLLAKANWGSLSKNGSAQSLITQINNDQDNVNYKLCGYTDWRLPNIHELQSLFSYRAGLRLDLWLMYGSGNSAMPDCDGDCFNNVANAGFWSSTSYAPRNDGKDEAWVLDSSGNISSYPVSWTHGVWPVRSYK